MIQFDEHIFQMGWFNHQLDQVKGFFFLEGLCRFIFGWLVGPVYFGWGDRPILFAHQRPTTSLVENLIPAEMKTFSKKPTVFYNP